MKSSKRSDALLDVAADTNIERRLFVVIEQFYRE
jgi:hypothetical protein